MANGNRSHGGLRFWGAIGHRLFLRQDQRLVTQHRAFVPQDERNVCVTARQFVLADI